MDEITAISVIDGRYRKLTEELSEIFSEFGLIKFRVHVEINWLKFLLKELKLSEINDSEIKLIDSINENFKIEDAKKIKDIEKITNHDVKAVEYFIKNKLSDMGLDRIKEWVHFSCTSEDISNASYAIMLKMGQEKIITILEKLLEKLESIALQYKSVSMMSRTHGQPASPTTMGKEFINFAWRLSDEIKCLKNIEVQAKINGATGNYNAHYFVFPEIDWISASKKFLHDYLGLSPVLFTTQINPYSYISKLLHSMTRISSIVIDLNRDMWGYISFGYFIQKIKEGEVGSSTMPHKVNPIDFENSEGNLGLSIPMMEHLAVKLLNSRFQRDLTDSTVLRNIGSIFGYFLIGIKNCMRGLNKIEINNKKIEEDLSENLELLAEPIQTAMRMFGEPDPYEKLKALTRGKKITMDELAIFIESLSLVPNAFKEKMKNLRVDKYMGLAEQLIDTYFAEKN
ncbi:MAG: adenylosuccinate lyase [Desulfobacterales bacterium]|nr:adenylosuccinate lyase [Desulfobacterales bacterium]